MALETVTHISDLVATNPTSSDPKSQGDDHVRNIKRALLASFAGFAGMVIVTGAEAQGATASDYTVTIAPAPAAYTASMLVLFKAAHTNIGPATVQVNALGTKPLLSLEGVALAAGDIASGSVVAAFYDGASFYLVSGNDRAARSGETYVGSHDFTGATLTAQTQAAGDSSTKVATTAFCAALAFLAALPGQAGNSGKFVTTDGFNASWSDMLEELHATSLYF